MDGVAGGVPIQKGNLSFNGGNIIFPYSGGNLTQLTFASQTRVDHGSLVIWDYLGDFGTNSQLYFTSLPAGMAPAYMVAATGTFNAAWNTGSFLTNGATGLTEIPYVSMPAGSGTGTEVVQITTATNLGGATKTVSALRADAAVTRFGRRR